MRRSVDLLITNAQIVTEQGILHQGALRIAKGTIVWSGSQDDTGFESHLRQAGQILDAKGGLLMPGFIDVHVHGGFGSDFMEADLSAYDTITRFHGAHGTTAMLATTVTASKESIDKVLAASEAYRQSVMRGARLLGVHLEGPFISPRWAGAQNPDYIVPPNQVWAEEWISRFPGLVRILTLAPETDGAMELIEWASQNGVVCAGGHTQAD
jgi:N-acetylglucosamine-6-phosphate deacetylase